jgi:hypothetical protein
VSVFDQRRAEGGASTGTAAATAAFWPETAPADAVDARVPGVRPDLAALAHMAEETAPETAAEPQSEGMAGGTQTYVPDLSHVTGKGARVRNRAIDAIIEEDFPHLELTHKPQYNPFMTSGIAVQGTGTQIGRNQFSTRADLRDTIIHEELHHRWWERGIASPHHASEHVEGQERFYETIERYKRMRGWLPKPADGAAATAETTAETTETETE